MTILDQKRKSQYDLRQELEELVVRDLLGPAAGPEEEIDERSVRDRYLVGMLAPKYRDAGSGAAAPADEASEEEDEFPPTLYDDSAEGGSHPSDDGDEDLDSPRGMNLFPSSIGLTFTADADAREIQITARWGYYKKAPSETHVKETGEPKRVWKRRPVEAVSPPIPLVEGALPDWIPSPDFPKVVVQGQVRRRDHGWSVTLFLVNGQTKSSRGQDRQWVFQPELIVESPDGASIFRRKTKPLYSSRYDFAGDQARDEMLYRHEVEFAVGHGASVRWERKAGERTAAHRIRTSVIPAHEVPMTDQPGPERMPGLVVDMKTLSELETPEDFRNCLGPLADSYHAWIEQLETKLDDPAEGLQDHRRAARDSISLCKETHARMTAGIDLLCNDPNEATREAFRFMNRAMHLQRIRTLHAEQVRKGIEPKAEENDVPKNRSWRPFQLAFILLNLPSLADLHHRERSTSPGASADLLWFPTGGGKTEAYLGLTAYALGIRRLQGQVGDYDGENGVAVLMRYTLRLLTLQQFQRATALICACEKIRRDALKEGDAKWGRTPFRIGLWVGAKTTPNKTDQSDEVVKQQHGQGYSQTVAGIGSPHQLNHCPWCGHVIDIRKDIKVETFENGRGRTLVFCGDSRGQCPFGQRNSPGEGLPVLVVDQEIYRLLPSLLIATVDKFAQMPWKGETQMLFGRVQGRCERHGFRSPEIEDSDSHPASSAKGLPKAVTVETQPIRPPDLIIQDELHLISGPLGSLVGLYETAIDALCTWKADGVEIRPKVIASTATIRRAPQQIHALFRRQVSIFPPPGLSIEDNFFSVQRRPCEQHPGRRYLGICATGRRIKAALIRVYVSYLAAAQTLYDKYGADADPWMTLVGYFNSLRDLGGTRRLVLDDIRSRLRDMEERGLSNRKIHEGSLEELTSRIRATDIPRILDRLELGFRPEMKGKDEKRPLDLLLATNMISVGVDVRRLGLMVVSSQPKSTADYIQSTSRVGRAFPGMVCTVYNWARPRDLSHYESFGHYHATFYKHVEGISVTPFSEGALERGLSGILVALTRLYGGDFNANDRCEAIGYHHETIQWILNTLPEHGSEVKAEASFRSRLEREIKSKLDTWLAKAQMARKNHSHLGYQQKKDGRTIGLLKWPGGATWDEFTCLTSLREVEPPVNLVLVDRGDLQDGTD